MRGDSGKTSFFQHLRADRRVIERSP